MSKFKRIALIVLSVIVMLSACIPVTAFAASESQIRSKIISIASNEVGYTGTSSYSKYGEWYGYQGSWCTTFALWCYNQAGSALGIGLYGGSVTPTGGNCNSMISWYQNKGRYHKRGDGYTPKTGDLVFFDWSGNGSSQHVGIVNYISSGTVYTIEGNCSGKVKERSYTTNGSKPYNNVSSIMGYASPDFSGVSSAGDTADTKKTSTTPKNTTTKKQNSATENKTTEKKTTTTKKETSTATTTEASTQPKKIERLELSAETQEMRVGDTVKLNYTIEPADTRAVVGYFCDDEGIVSIGSGGDITAIGKGTATVVVCVNDELYSQCNFSVADAAAEVTTLTAEQTTRKIVGKTENTTQLTDTKDMLSRLGVNVDKLTSNTGLYFIPASIICLTAVICVIISIRRRNSGRKDNGKR